MISCRSFRRELTAIPEAARWLDAMAEEARVPEALLFGMQICLEELFSNIVRHGGPVDPARSEVRIAIEAGAGFTRLTFEDEGPAFDVAKAVLHPVASSIEDVRPGGLGIRLVRAFSRNLTYTRAGNCNRVTIDFSE